MTDLQQHPQQPSQEPQPDTSIDLADPTDAVITDALPPPPFREEPAFRKKRRLQNRTTFWAGLATLFVVVMVAIGITFLVIEINNEQRAAVMLRASYATRGRNDITDLGTVVPRPAIPVDEQGVYQMCTLLGQERHGNVSMSFALPKGHVMQDEVAVLQDLFRKVYNRVTGMCNGHDIYQRVLRNATLATFWEMQITPGRYVTTWKAAVNCHGCPRDDPLFGLSEIDVIANNNNNNQLPLAMRDEFVTAFRAAVADLQHARRRS